MIWSRPFCGDNHTKRCRRDLAQATTIMPTVLVVAEKREELRRITDMAENGTGAAPDLP